MRSKKKIVISVALVFLLLLAGVFIYFKFFASSSKIQNIISSSVATFSKISQFLPIADDTKKETAVIGQLVEHFNAQDNQERSYLLLLQNNMELRPGGGFLGQYAVVKIKNGQVTYSFFEDANLLDQRITVKVAPPYPFQRMMSIKKWKFSNSNFSPDFPTNVDKAKYFYKLGRGAANFDGVIAINASVLNRVLEIIGPVTVNNVEYNSQNAVLKLEEQVEKAYLFNEDLDTQNRKWIMKEMAKIILDRLMKLQNIPKLADFTLNELRNKDVMLNFQDSALQEKAESVGWAGKINTTWDKDYLAVVDANMGALKSDYYIKREMDYSIDLTLPKPVVTLKIKYTHTATAGDWRTSDYHSYLRVYVPQGANLLERKMVSYPNIQEELGKTYFCFILHTLIGRSTEALIKYELPEKYKENYQLLIQKQSGVGDVPITLHLKDQNGEVSQSSVLKKDLNFTLQEKVQ